MMKRLFSAALLLAAIAAPAFPLGNPYSTVTGTVTDANGIPYGGAKITAQLSSPGATVTINDAGKCQSGGQGAAPCHLPITGTYPTQLDPTGAFTLVVPTNGQVQPAGTSYTFTVSISPGVLAPFGTGAQTFTITATINNDQDISSQLDAAAPALTNSVPGSGNVSAAGTLASGDLVCGGGSKSVVDCGVALSAVALLNSPTFTGTPAAPTAALGTNTTQIATMAALQAALGGQVLNADVTPLTVTGTASVQVNLKTFTFAAGALNKVGKTFAFQAHGSVAPSSGSQSNTCPAIEIITISYPSSGLCDAAYTTAASWGFSGICTVVTAGATGELVCSLTYGVATGPGNPLGVFDDSGFQYGGGFGFLDLTAAQTMTIQWNWSPGNVGNSAVENNLYVQLLN